MQITIDNNDGNGPLNYTPALSTVEPLTIRRKRFFRAFCSGVLDVQGVNLPVPPSRGRVVVTNAAGAVLFQGYLSAGPAFLAAEQTTPGLDMLLRFVAVEDAWVKSAPVDTSLQPATAITHVFPAGEGRLRFLELHPQNIPEMVDEVSLTGEDEATTYVTELFQGDGTTAAFTLQHAPFREAGSETLLNDAFDRPTLDSAVWSRNDPGEYLSLGNGGFLMNGGSGADGGAVLRYVPPVEMGGTLIAEAGDVLLNPGSDGVLLGFYAGAVTAANCIAGVRVVGAAGAQTLAAFVNGAEVGAPFTWQTGHAYVLRVRLFCREVQRVLASYASLANGSVQSFGGGTVPAPLNLVIELQDMGVASSTAPTVLYQGSLASSPAQCIFALANSTALSGSIGAVSLQQQGSCEVVSTPAGGGTPVVRRTGTAASGADCNVGTSGVLSFFPGHVPAAGELVTVSYRIAARAAARIQNAAAVTGAQQRGQPGLPSWTGHVVTPKARSSTDCMAAAQAVLAAGSDPTVGMNGWLTVPCGSSGPDVQAGDVMTAGSGTQSVTVPVATVEVTDGHSVPELLTYRIGFTASRKERLAFTVSDGQASDIALPLAQSHKSVVANLPGLQVVSASTTALQVDTGTDPPGGGGFEVRRDDASFGATSTTDLVLRSAVRTFSLQRASFRERFFIRMYDSATPPNYSQWSSAVFTNLPTS